MNHYNVQAEFQGSYKAKRTRTALLVHHAAALYPTATGVEDVRAVHRYHLSKGWGGIGYHVCLAEEKQGGAIARYVCSDLNLQRAHILNRNHEFLGVSCLTNFDTHPNGLPDPKWFVALAETLHWLRELYPNAAISGHKDEAVAAGRTSCPGWRWNDWKSDLIHTVTGFPARVDPWDAWGDEYPLPPEQRHWGIPQRWLKERERFGEARSPEIWNESQTRSRREFQGGILVYDKAGNTVHPLYLPRIP